MRKFYRSSRPLLKPLSLQLNWGIRVSKMDIIADKFKSLANSGDNFVAGICRRFQTRSRRNAIEILKRLQREAFADLMKLRDRQDKVERVLNMYRTSKGSPFQEDGTLVSGEVDVLGCLFLMDHLDEDNVDAIRRAGIRTGFDARIIFESKVRQKYFLEAEFITTQSSHRDSNDILGTLLSLAKVSYTANVADWFSISAIPMGARCRDMEVSTSSSFQERGLTNYSCLGPSLLHHNLGGGIGIKVKKSNVIASLAQFIGDLPGSFEHSFSTFGQIVYQLPKSLKLSLFGLHHMPTKSREHPSVGPLTLPLGILRPRNSPQTSTGTYPASEARLEENSPTGLLAVMLESELDESTKVQGWAQLRNNNPNHLEWAVSMKDFAEDEIGWGLSLGGVIHGPSNLDQFQIEAFLKFNLGNGLSLQPGFVYVMNANHQTPALIIRSTWSL